MVTGLVAGAAIAWVAGASAQDWRVVSGDGWCNDGDGGWDRARHCEVREVTWSPGGRVSVDAAPNGGIEVTAGEGNEVRLQAKVTAVASTEEAARRLASEVRIATSGTISATGPDTGRREWWSVSYRLTVPARTDLDLRSHNGGIVLTGVRGRTEFETTNGGVKVRDAGGSLRGRTTNGGVKVALSGSQWDGEGLDVVTTNGGVVLEVPEGYNAHLETGTVNGGVEMDFPVRVQGRLGRKLSTDLGSGGPTVRASTTNGGVVIKRR
jgi:DUF4097 and DUF4098 domain-containing protein YvlB